MDDYIFKITICSKPIKYLLFNLSKILDITTLNLYKDKIIIMDKKDDILFHGKFEDKIFSEYYVVEDYQLHIDLKRIRGVLENIRNDSYLTISKKKDTEYWCLDNDDKYPTNYKIQNIGRWYKKQNIKPQTFDRIWTMKSEILIEWIKNMKKHKCEMFDLDVEDDNMSIVYGYKGYLSKYLKYCGYFTDWCNEINIYKKDNFPLIFSYENNLGNIKICIDKNYI
tara:strand:+ start:4725 stop:5396 length:672 start_codon:yes stop_codon:yes gene_type:complete